MGKKTRVMDMCEYAYVGYKPSRSTEADFRASGMWETFDEKRKRYIKRTDRMFERYKKKQLSL